MSQSQKRKRSSNPVLSLLDLPALQIEQIIGSLPVESLDSLRRSSKLILNYIDSTTDVLKKLYQEEIARKINAILQKIQKKPRTVQSLETKTQQILNDYSSFIHNEFLHLTHLKDSLTHTIQYLQTNVNTLNRQDLTPRERATDQKNIQNMGELVTILQKIDARLQKLS